MRLNRDLFQMLIGAAVMAMSCSVHATTYNEAVMAANPHAYFTMDETSGTTAFNQVGFPAGENGTYVNGPTLGAAANGQLGTAVSFDGTNDLVRILDPHNPTDYTLEAWVKLDALPTSFANILWRTDAGESGSFSHILQVLGDGRFVHYTFDGGTRSVTSTTVAQVGRWYHVVGVYHPGATGVGFMSIYINGVLEQNWNFGVLNNPWTGGNRWLIGDTHASGPFLKASVDEVAIYHSLLSANTIAAHFAAATIPEPATATLGLLALGGLMLRRRRMA